MVERDGVGEAGLGLSVETGGGDGRPTEGGGGILDYRVRLGEKANLEKSLRDVSLSYYHGTESQSSPTKNHSSRLSRVETCRSSTRA